MIFYCSMCSCRSRCVQSCGMKKAERAASKLRAAGKKKVNEVLKKGEIDAKIFAEDRVEVKASLIING